jgi:antitoxin VapB
MIALNRVTEELARRLAVHTGKSPDEIIQLALEDRARSAGIPLPDMPRRSPSFDRMKEISDRFSALPILDDRPADDIIGYDDVGVPG